MNTISNDFGWINTISIEDLGIFLDERMLLSHPSGPTRTVVGDERKKIEERLRREGVIS